MSRILSNVSFASKVVVVTGASSGIGAETAVHFAALGANLVLTGRNADRLKATAEKCRARFADPSKQRVFEHVADLTIANDVETLVATTLDNFARIDVLVNNAGTIEFGTIESTTMEQYDRVMNANLRCVYQLTMLAVPHLVATKGNIVNVSSVNGIRAFQNVLAYCISKSGLDQFTRCTALELAGKGVRVNSVNPGVVNTGLHVRGGLPQAKLDAFLEHSKTTHALGRTGEVSEVAATITFLASDSASFITGASIPVDGGRHAMCPR